MFMSKQGSRSDKLLVQIHHPNNLAMACSYAQYIHVIRQFCYPTLFFIVFNLEVHSCLRIPARAYAVHTHSWSRYVREWVCRSIALFFPSEFHTQSGKRIRLTDLQARSIGLVAGRCVKLGHHLGLRSKSYLTDFNYEKCCSQF